MGREKASPAPDPDAYVASLAGWQRPCVQSLRAVVSPASELTESIRWGHLVYLAQGPVCLLRAERHRVLFGFWRGRRLRTIEPRLKPSGGYERATIELRAGEGVAAEIVARLVREVIALNLARADPRLAAKRSSRGRFRPALRPPVGAPRPRRRPHFAAIG